MKIKISKNQWETIGKTAGWLKKAQSQDFDISFFKNRLSFYLAQQEQIIENADVGELESLKSLVVNLDKIGLPQQPNAIRQFIDNRLSQIDYAIQMARTNPQIAKENLKNCLTMTQNIVNSI